MYPGTVTLRWPRVTSSPRIVYQLCRVYIHIRVCLCATLSCSSFDDIGTVSWQLCYFAVHPWWRDRRVSAHVQSCLISNLSAFLCTIPRTVQFKLYHMMISSRYNVAYCVVHYVVRIDTRTSLFTSFYPSVRKISMFFFEYISNYRSRWYSHFNFIVIIIRNNDCSTAIFDFQTSLKYYI